MPELFGVSLVEQIACVEREIKLRERVYPRRIAARQMSKDLADRELERMRAVLATLHDLERGDRGPL